MANAQKAPTNRRATIIPDHVGYVEQKMREWGTDYSTTVNTIILEHKRARIDIQGAVAQPPFDEADDEAGSRDSDNHQLDHLTALLNFGIST